MRYDAPGAGREGHGGTLLVAGSTGLVGGWVVRLAREQRHWRTVVALARRPIPAAHGLEVRVIDFTRMAERPEALRADAVVCALGTTRRQAGSREAFRLVDLEYPLGIARLALDQGARHFVLVSALGADAGSRIFYNRVKGELEEAILALPYRSVSILRPSLLLGERREVRLAETVAARLWWAVPRRLRPVHAQQVAATALRLAGEDTPGRRVIESEAMVG